MFPHISHIILVISVSLLSCNPEKAIGQNAAGLHNETLVITAYERLMELYIDGQPQSLTNELSWSLPDYVQLQPTNRLIALYAANLAYIACEGVLASVLDGSFLTNNEWKCSSYEEPNYSDLGFDDSRWPNAVEFGSNGNHSRCGQVQSIGNISSDAKWIWTGGLAQYDAFCRSYLPFCENSSPCLNNGTCLKNDVRFCDCLPQFTGTKCETELYNETLVITANEQLVELYIDGVHQQTLVNGNNWNQSDYIEVPPMSRLIALNAINNGDTLCAGVLASIFEAYPLTSSNWKCTTSNGGNTDWIHLGYDDSGWSNAAEYGSNAEGHTGCPQMQNIVDVNPNAHWIWTDNPSSDLIVYCRGYLQIPTTIETTALLSTNNIQTTYSLETTEDTPTTKTVFHLLSVVELGLISVPQFSCTKRNLSVLADNKMKLYFDGVEITDLPNADIWYKVDAVDLPCDTRLIAIHGQNVNTNAGILGSTDDDYILTNSTWTCSNVSHVGWEEIEFDDSTWTSAVDYGPSYIPGISSNAAWIWLRQYNTSEDEMDMDVYCRKRLHTEFTLTITAKTTLYELYIDGVSQSLSHATNVSVADEILLPSFGRLVAVTAIDTTSTCAGILASATGDYLLTDASWKCHTDGPPQWYTIGFDDTDWIDAYVIGPNNNVTWPEECRILNGVASISQNADWIWTSSIVNTPNYDDIIYCRAYLPLCELDSPCQNGGTCNRNSVILCTCLHDYTGVFCENEITRRLSITAKSTVHEFYIDGIKTNLTYNNNWTVADEIELTSVNRLISVLAVDSTSTCAGILTSVTDDFMVTDASWRCRIGAPPQWYILGFDDSDWTDTYVIGPNANVSWPEQCKVLTEIPAISQNAYWIWTSTIPDVPFYDSIIYCRAYLPICEKVQPCRNGGTCRENSVNLCTCPIGFTGVYCESVACNGDAPCQNGGTCIQGNSEPCLCPPEFTGTFCEFSSLTTESLTAATMADH